MRGSKPGKNVQLTENEIKGLCIKSREIFLSQPILLELEAPLKICGEFSALFSQANNYYNFYKLSSGMHGFVSIIICEMKDNVSAEYM